jgi:hypothetical protein
VGLFSVGTQARARAQDAYLDADYVNVTAPAAMPD